MTMNGHTPELLKNIFYDVQTEGKGEINMAKYFYFKNISIEWLKGKLLY